MAAACCLATLMGGHQVHAAAMDLEAVFVEKHGECPAVVVTGADPTLVCALIRPSTFETWKEGVVNVDDPTRHLLAEIT